MKTKLDKVQVVNAAKMIGSWAVPGSTVSLATGLVRLVVPPGVNVAVQGAMCLGGIILGRFLGERMTDYVCDKIDKTAEEIEELASYVGKRVDIIQNQNIEKEETNKEE